MTRGRASIFAKLLPAWSGILAAFVLFGCSKSEQSTNAPPAAAAPLAAASGTADGSARVIVDSKGFNPSRVTLDRGKPGTITFVRTSNQTCADKVVFPELSIKKDLPLNQPVTVEVPTTEAKSYTFQCGMGMYKSAVVVQ